MHYSQNPSKTFTIIITGLLAILFIISMAFDPNSQPVFSSDKLAKVGKTYVTKDDLTFSYRKLAQYISSQNPQIPENQLIAIIDKEIWPFIHNNYGIQDLMNEYHYTVPDTKFQDFLINNNAFKYNGTFSKKIFTDYLKRMNINFSFFSKDLKRQMLHDAFQKNIEVAFEFSNAEKEIIRLSAHHNRSLIYKIIDPKKINITKPISEKDIKAYFDLHQTEFIVPEKNQFQFTLIKPNYRDTSSNYQRDDLLKFYQEHSDRYMNQSKYRIKLIHINKDETQKLDQQSLDLVKAYMYATERNPFLEKIIESKGTGYSVSFTDKWYLDSELPNHIHENQILSQEFFVIPKSSENVIVVHRAGQVLKTTKPFSKVEKEVRNDLHRFNVLGRFNEVFEEAADQLHYNEINLEEFAKRFDQKVKVSKLMTANEFYTLLPSSKEKLNQAYVSIIQSTHPQLISLGQDQYAIIKLSKKSPERLLSFKEARPQIIGILKNQEKNMEAEHLIRKVEYKMNKLNVRQFNHNESPWSFKKDINLTSSLSNGGYLPYFLSVANDKAYSFKIDNGWLSTRVVRENNSNKNVSRFMYLYESSWTRIFSKNMLSDLTMSQPLKVYDKK